MLSADRIAAEFAARVLVKVAAPISEDNATGYVLMYADQMADGQVLFDDTPQPVKRVVAPPPPVPIAAAETVPTPTIPVEVASKPKYDNKATLVAPKPTGAFDHMSDDELRSFLIMHSVKFDPRCGRYKLLRRAEGVR